DLSLRLLEMGLERLAQLRVRRRLRQFRQRLRQLFLRVVRVAQFVNECIVERPYFGHGRGLLLVIQCEPRQTRGGSVSLAKCRCFAIAATKSSVTDTASEATRTPGSACPFGNVGSIPHAWSNSALSPSAGIDLQCRYWSLMNSRVRPSARSALTASAPLDN